MSNFSKGFNYQRPDKSIHDPTLAGPLWVYGSLLLSWLLDLLPSSHWPFFPSFLVMTLIFWAIHQPNRIFYWFAFCLGLLTDADTGAVFGQHALTYCVVVFCAELMSVRLLWLSPISQAISLLPVFLLPAVLKTVESFLLSQQSFDAAWFLQVLLFIVFWPLWVWFLSRRFYLG